MRVDVSEDNVRHKFTKALTIAIRPIITEQDLALNKVVEIADDINTYFPESEAINFRQSRKTIHNRNQILQQSNITIKIMAIIARPSVLYLSEGWVFELTRLTIFYIVLMKQLKVG